MKKLILITSLALSMLISGINANTSISIEKITVVNLSYDPVRGGPQSILELFDSNTGDQVASTAFDTMSFSMTTNQQYEYELDVGMLNVPICLFNVYNSGIRNVTASSSPLSDKNWHCERTAPWTLTVYYKQV